MRDILSGDARIDDDTAANTQQKLERATGALEKSGTSREKHEKRTDDTTLPTKRS
jgi:hypothetical protein